MPRFPSLRPPATALPELCLQHFVQHSNALTLSAKLNLLDAPAQVQGLGLESRLITEVTEPPLPQRTLSVTRPEHSMASSLKKLFHDPRRDDSGQPENAHIVITR